MTLEPLLALPQLRTFYGVALSGTFSAAADRLGRTPSAVSHAISTLENTVGVQLVDRRGKTVRLTDEGQRLLTACRAVYAILEDAGDDLRQAGTRLRRLIRLGAPPEFGCSVLMRLIAPFLEAHPDIDVDFRLSHDLLTPLLRDEVDIALDCFEHLEADLHATPLFRETYMVVCAPGFARRHGLRLPADLSKVAVLSVDKEGTWWHRFQRALPAKSRPVLRRVVMVNHVRGMIAAAEAGMGVALVPSYSVASEVGRAALVQLFPSIALPEDRFRIYQKKARVPLDRHRRLVAFLQSVEPGAFGFERRG